MSAAVETRRRRRVRSVTFVGLAFAGVVGTAIPALAHASFPGYSANGFAPNPSGGTGLPGSTPPYAANTAVSIATRVPFEQTEPHDGSDDTTTDVMLIVPAGWTNPTCGAAKTQINDASTNNTNQPGSDVAGWTCEITTVGANQAVHWSGPQVEAPATFVNSAQFFIFGVTTPLPTEQTTYNGTNGTEGFIVQQTYASGEISYWIPNADYPGNPPQGANSIVAAGLARTVAQFDPATTSTTTSTTTTTLVSTTTTAPATTSTTARSGSAAAAVVAAPRFAG